MKIEWIESVGSTNAYLKDSNGVGPMTMVCARQQTAGRGQRGNSWESEPDKNLTFSFFMENLPVAPREQFVVSEAVALAMADAAEDYGIEALIKWPNDIYAGNRKIAGILIENSIMGNAISRSIAGIGLNVNQTLFRSDAPNPVSMAMISGLEYDLEAVAQTVARRLDARIGQMSADREELHREYMRRLWRGDGRLYPFRETATGRKFEGAVEGVEPDGHILLRDSAGDRRRFAFKEIIWL